MKILVVGNQLSLTESKDKFGLGFQYNSVEDIYQASELEEYDYILDFVIDEFPEHFEQYIVCKRPVVLLNTVKISLGELQYTYGPSSSKIYGFNGLPTFLDRQVLEISCLNKSDISQDLKKLNTEWITVDDRVGMVTPRIILMIINEAFYTVQEGTANREDIDQGMKLGTNYPFGPFEWSHKIGINHVYETLEAIYEDTKDERYKIAPLLKQEYLKG